MNLSQHFLFSAKRWVVNWVFPAQVSPMGVLELQRGPLWDNQGYKETYPCEDKIFMRERRRRCFCCHHIYDFIDEALRCWRPLNETVTFSLPRKTPMVAPFACYEVNRSIPVVFVSDCCRMFWSFKAMSFRILANGAKWRIYRVNQPQLCALRVLAMKMSDRCLISRSRRVRVLQRGR